jgi:hypothetical protein
VEHWFDTFTRGLGSRRLTRRGALGLWLKLCLAATMSLLARAVSSRSGGVASAAPAATALAASTPTCTVDDSYGVLTSVATATSSDPAMPLSLTHTFIAEVGSGTTHATLIVTPGATPSTVTTSANSIVRMTTTSLPNRLSQASTRLGAAFTGDGVRTAGFSTDGVTVRGTVDGRPAEPVPVGAAGRRLTPNGPSLPGPSAVTGLTPRGEAVQRSVDALLAQATTQIGTCRPNPSSSPVVATCTSCQLTCRETWLSCAIPAIQSALKAGVHAPSNYLAIAQAACDAPLQQCLQTCKSSGACCPSFCNGDAACCQSAWGCCPPSSHSRRQWSRSWPTCPRCGTPPWTSATTTPVRPAPGQTCNPRPPIAVTTRPAGPNALQVTVAATRSPSTAPNNTLARVEIGAARNADLDVGGQIRPAAGVTIPVTAGTQTVSFTIRRQTAGQATTVPLTVTDDCGAWKTLVGGGATAF